MCHVWKIERLKTLINRSFSEPELRKLSAFSESWLDPYCRRQDAQQNFAKAMVEVRKQKRNLSLVVFKSLYTLIDLFATGAAASITREQMARVTDQLRHLGNDREEGQVDSAMESFIAFSTTLLQAFVVVYPLPFSFLF